LSITSSAGSDVRTVTAPRIASQCASRSFHAASTREGSRYTAANHRAASRPVACPSRKCTCAEAPGARSRCTWSAAHGSSPGRTAFSSPIRPSAAGAAYPPLRPRNSARSAVSPWSFRLAATKATRRVGPRGAGTARARGSEAGVPGAVADLVGGAGRRGPRRRGPDGAGLLVAQVQHLARLVGDRIVPPGSQPVLAGVLRPGVAAARLGDDEAQAPVGHHVHPGRRRRRLRLEVDDVLEQLHLGGPRQRVVEVDLRLPPAGPRLAVVMFASCDGCHLSVLNLEDDLLALGQALDIAFFPEASSRMDPGPYDIALVEGSISTPADLERIAEVRHQAKVLITSGACATAGGIQALRNWASVEAHLARGWTPGPRARGRAGRAGRFARPPRCPAAATPRSPP
jgi:Ni,Fe-hydrogenase III small subunit